MSTKKKKVETVTAAPAKLGPGVTWTDPHTEKRYEAREGMCPDGCAFGHLGDGCMTYIPDELVCAGSGCGNNFILVEIEDGAATAKREEDRKMNSFVVILVEGIKDSPYQTRKKIGDISELVGSVRQFGIINPVTVRKIGKGHELIAGHRRLAAVRKAGLQTIPAIVVDCDDRAAAELCVTENLQRIDLSPLEEAEGVRSLLDTGHSRQDIALRLGKSEKWVARRANLNKLCKGVVKLYEDSESTFSRMPVEGLELIAALPAEAQQRLLLSSLPVMAPTLARIRGAIANEMHDLKGAPFATADCLECIKRTSVQPDLFEGADSCPLGRCLDSQCWTRRQKAGLAALVDGIRKEAPGVVIIADDYKMMDLVAGLASEYAVNECKKSDAGATLAYKVDSDGNAKKVWIRKGRGATSPAAQPASAQPTPEQKRMAAVCRRVHEMIGETLTSDGEQKAKALNPFRRLSLEDVIFVTAVAGTQHSSNYANPSQWDEESVTGGAPRPCDILWARVAPVLQARVKFMTVSTCEEQYSEAVIIAERLFDIKEADLDQQVKKGK